MIRRRRENLRHSKGYIQFPQRTVQISHNPNGTHDVFLHSVMGVITCSRYIRNPRRPASQTYFEEWLSHKHPAAYRYWTKP